jgi:subtilisin family serine protease
MKIAIIDSGINESHPHVRAVAGGVGITNSDGWMEDTSDRLGHGTAVAAAICEKMPEADLYAVKVFDRGFFARASMVLKALQWCRYYRMDIVSLSIGIDDASQSAALEGAVAGQLVFSPARQLPGCLPGAIPVEADEGLPRDEFSYRDGIFYASPRPRPAAGPVLQGVDFAVANMAGIAARVLPSIAHGVESAAHLRERLLAELESLAYIHQV